MVEARKGNPIHRLTIAAIEASLRNMAQIMDKAESHAAKNTIGLDVYLQARLYPDMYNLLQQVQYVCYISVDFARHFSDAPAPHVGYDETTWPELRKGLDTAADYLHAIPAARVAEQVAKIVPLFYDDAEGMTAVDYAAAVTLPDFHFHMAIAYAILRHNGVPLGKADFLGKLDTVALTPAPR